MNHIDSPFHSVPSAMLATPKTAWFRRPVSGPISEGSYGSGDEFITILSSNHLAFLQQIFMFWQRKRHLQKVGDLHHLGSRVHGLWCTGLQCCNDRRLINLRAAKFWGVIGHFWRQPFLWVWHPKGWGMTPAACKSATTALFLDMFKQYICICIYIFILIYIINIYIYK